MTRTEAWLLVAAGAGLLLCAQSLWHAIQDTAEAIEEIAARAEARARHGAKLYHSAASTDARRPGTDATEKGGRHAAD